MKRTLMFVAVLFCSAFTSYAQIDFVVRRADNDEEVSLKTLLAGKDGQSKKTFLVTWSGSWCFPCMEVIASLDKSAKTGIIQLLAVNVDDDWSTIKKEGYHTKWANTTNLYIDNELSNSFSSYFTVENAPVVIFFNEAGNIQYMDASFSLRSYMFVDYFGKEFIWEDHQSLNTLAWNYYLDNEDKDKVIPKTDEEMAKALEYVKRSIEIDPNYNNTDTYAALLYLTGEYTEALKTAKEAIDIAKANGDDYETTSELIQKIIEKM